MRATINQVQKRNYTWIIVLILIIGPVVLELTLGDRLYNATHDDIVKAQEFSSKNLNLEVFDNSKDKPDYTSPISDIFISEFLHAINSNAFYILLCAFLYNFMNVYKIFLLYMTIFLSNLLAIEPGKTDPSLCNIGLVTFNKPVTVLFTNIDMNLLILFTLYKLNCKQIINLQM